MASIKDLEAALGGATAALAMVVGMLDTADIVTRAEVARNIRAMAADAEGGPMREYLMVVALNLDVPANDGAAKPILYLLDGGAANQPLVPSEDT